MTLDNIGYCLFTHKSEERDFRVFVIPAVIDLLFDALHDYSKRARFSHRNKHVDWILVALRDGTHTELELTAEEVDAVMDALDLYKDDSIDRLRRTWRVAMLECII